MSMIIVDSGADLPKSYIEEHGLVFIPFTYTFGETVYADDMGASMSVPEFYRMLREGKMSTTAQATPNDFIETMTPYLQKGEDLLYIAFSSALSGTYQSGMLAKKTLEQEFPDRRILVVDSACASAGLGLLIDYAVRMFEEGTDIAEIARWLEDKKGYIHQWFTVDDLNHLRRGGRVSGAAALAGTLLSIKPILYINSKGELIPISKIRGRRHALRSLADRMEEFGADLSDQRIFLCHGDSLEDSEYVADMIRQRFGISDILTNYVGPIIGTHTGPGILIVAFMGKTMR